MKTANVNRQPGYGNPGVQLGQGRQGESNAQTVAELRLEAATYNFGGIQLGDGFDSDMEASAKLFYKSWVRVPQLIAIFGIVGLSLYLCGNLSSILTAVIIFSMLVFSKDVVKWLWVFPRDQWLQDYIHKHGTRMAALFNASAVEFNGALRQLKNLVPDAKNVDQELCQGLHWARKRMQYGEWVEADLRTYLASLLAIGEANSRPDAKIKRFV